MTMFIPESLISILLGVVSGIITAVIIGIISLIFKNILIPWFREFVYNGVNISGNWSYKSADHKSIPEYLQEISLDIEQRANRVRGTFRSKVTSSSKDYINYYKITGEVKNNYLLFTYHAQKNDRTGLGSFLLRVSHGGTQLVGTAVFTPDANVDDTEVCSMKEMIFKRS